MTSGYSNMQNISQPYQICGYMITYTLFTFLRSPATANPHFPGSTPNLQSHFHGFLLVSESFFSPSMSNIYRKGIKHFIRRCLKDYCTFDYFGSLFEHVMWPYMCFLSSAVPFNLSYKRFDYILNFFKAFLRWHFSTSPCQPFSTRTINQK